MQRREMLPEAVPPLAAAILLRAVEDAQGKRLHEDDPAGTVDGARAFLQSQLAQDLAEAAGISLERYAPTVARVLSGELQAATRRNSGRRWARTRNPQGGRIAL